MTRLNPEIYLDAAERVRATHHHSTCAAVMFREGDSGIEHFSAYYETFRPDDPVEYLYWGLDWGDGHKAAALPCRELALLFMAAIAETEDFDHNGKMIGARSQPRRTR